MAERELPIRKMMDACDRDEALQAQLFKEPDAVAKKFGVQLSPEEKAQIARVADLYRIVDEFTAGRIVGPGPIFYPVDVWWKRRIFNHVLSYRSLFNPIFDHVFYPIDILRIDLARQFEGLRLRRR